MKFNYLIVLLLFSHIACKKTVEDPSAKLLVNHLGYNTDAVKKVILQTSAEQKPYHTFEILSEEGEVVFESSLDDGGQIDNWHTGKAYAGSFTELQATGKFYAQIPGTSVKSETFEIGDDVLAERTLPLLLKGLKSIHPAEEYEQWDAKVPFHGDRSDSVDVHGGWYDASGDYSKYLSHLCYTNFMAPQQTPMVAYNLYESAQLMRSSNSGLATDFEKEAAYGADFLVRMQDPAGYFYTIVFDNWSKDVTRRAICAYETQNGNRTDEYKAAFREGAGITIAALARLAADSVSGEYSHATYLEVAEKGFGHLVENNTSYCDDGKENIIDDYCALMAANELYLATGKDNYLEYARQRAQNLNQRIRDNENVKGWMVADSENRPYFHAAEAGYPLIALNRYLDFEKDKALRTAAIETIKKHIDFQLSVRSEVVNPFGYPRQYVKGLNEEARTAFFIPHDNESGYWYQGENARLASLASAFNVCKPYLRIDQKQEVDAFVQDQVNWILGLNPYNMCMLDGIGQNNPEYLAPHDWNYVGGIANGITAGVDDESDIAYLPSPQDTDLAQNWRWPEQWIPHAGWFMLAVTSSIDED